MKLKIANILKSIGRFYKDKLERPLTKVAMFLYVYLGVRWLVKKYQGLTERTRNRVTGLMFVSPWFVGLYMFGIRPFLNSIRMSLADQAQYIINTQTQTVEFVLKGWTFKHLTNLIKNQPGHIQTITSVFADVALVVPLVLVFSLVLALMLNQGVKGKGIFRVIFFIPVILLSGNLLSYFNQYNLLSVPAVANGLIARQINRFLPGQFTGLIIDAFEKIVLILWLSGVQTLIFLAGLQKRNQAIYEAAAIDGASMWDSFWKITLPSLQNLMIINVIYTVIIYTNLSNNALIGLINQTLVDVRFGRSYSSVLAWMLFLIELVIIGAYTLVIKLSNRRYN